jgi:hypothetical protein
MIAPRHLCSVSLAVLFIAAPLAADERLHGIACRSVHLAYPAPEGLAFYNEVTVERSARGTYFAVCGWDRGYFGLQELGDGKKLLIFSVWDSGQNDPKAVAEEKRVQLVHRDEKVRTGRFGGEGTGGQSFYDYDWKVGETYRFLVTARPDGQRTEYAGWFFVPEEKAWKRLIVFSTITGGKPLRGYYSFVEDFQRDRVSTTHARRARYGSGWVLGGGGKWTALARARFTADANPDLRIDAGPAGDRFFLATGGDTRNAGTKLKETIELPPAPGRKPPEGLPAVDGTRPPGKDAGAPAR